MARVAERHPAQDILYRALGDRAPRPLGDRLGRPVEGSRGAEALREVVETRPGRAHVAHAPALPSGAENPDAVLTEARPPARPAAARDGLNGPQRARRGRQPARRRRGTPPAG